MNQGFPQNGYQLRILHITSATTTNLTTGLNVSGQPPCVGIVNLVCTTAMSAGLEYLIDSVASYVAIDNGIATKVANVTPMFVFPMSVSNAAGVASTRVEVITLGTGTCDVLFLVDPNAPDVA